MSEVSDTLRAARKLIERPENWCKGLNAADESGRFVPSRSKCAVRWCTVGALRAASGLGAHAIRSPAAEALVKAVPDHYTGPINFNDHPDTTHPMVLDLFDRAIEMEEADG